MTLGINYPWLNYDWDFGIPPPGWTLRAAWVSRLETDLDTFQRSNIQVVRWFILGSGMLYGRDGLAPHRSGDQWRFDQIPAIDPAILEDFRQLLQIFSSRGMKLLPVLMDFKWAFPGLDERTTDAATLKVWFGRLGPNTMSLQKARQNAKGMPQGFVKGGRSDVMYDRNKSMRFFKNVLSPLLALSSQFHDTIYAWELINEPEWITKQKGIGGDLPERKRIPLLNMLQFIRDGMMLIQNSGFVSTVGFARARTIPDWEFRTYKRMQAATQKILLPDDNHLKLGLNQVHYYPADPLDTLFPARFSNRQTTILGEFATRVHPEGWPELSEAQQGISERLRLAQTKGYAAAFPWSYLATDQHTESDKNSITAAFTASLT